MTLDTSVPRPSVTRPIGDDDLLSAAEAGAVLLSGSVEVGSAVALEVVDEDGTRVSATLVADAEGGWDSAPARPVRRSPTAS